METAVPNLAPEVLALLYNFNRIKTIHLARLPQTFPSPRRRVRRYATFATCRRPFHFHSQLPVSLLDPSASKM